MVCLLFIACQFVHTISQFYVRIQGCNAVAWVQVSYANKTQQG